jgi:hypothetical protein
MYKALGLIPNHTPDPNGRKPTWGQQHGHREEFETYIGGTVGGGQRQFQVSLNPKSCDLKAQHTLPLLSRSDTRPELRHQQKVGMEQVTKVKYQHQKKNKTLYWVKSSLRGLLPPDDYRVQARVLYHVQPVPLGCIADCALSR